MVCRSPASGADQPAASNPSVEDRDNWHQTKKVLPTVLGIQLGIFGRLGNLTRYQLSGPKEQWNINTRAVANYFIQYTIHLIIPVKVGIYRNERVTIVIMKLSVALVALLPAVIAAPFTSPGAGDASAVNARDQNFEIVNDATYQIDNSLNTAKVAVGKKSDSDLTPNGDITAVIAPEVEVLGERGGDGSVAVEVLADDVKSIGTQLKTRERQVLSKVTAGAVDGLTSSLGLEVIDDSLAFSDILGKRALSPTEILANARNALSAAESDYEKYPNEITRAAYGDAIATIQSLIEPKN
ncbi:hypothetical protein V495_03983 [Pseudogymnoascus sp. VKM F-4514 (FW-929)]|nr:hypothetical protein V495_03983 [Pseudogymnoascus sp. VKM F-4514 (FW-929)]KFY56647.1 hypothetical protein V497_06064 [Pseudogymnoascus sp. VKM F-4516 (FW-969)]